MREGGKERGRKGEKGERERARERERERKGERLSTYNFLAVVALSEVLVRSHKEGVRHVLSTL